MVDFIHSLTEFKVFHVPQIKKEKKNPQDVYVYVLFVRLCLYQYQIHQMHWIFWDYVQLEYSSLSERLSLVQYDLSLTQLFMVATLQPVSPPEKLIQVL